MLEPALMQLRFSQEVLRPHFHLEMVGPDTIVAKVTFERESAGRRFQLASGGWFEGSPGYHIDVTEGIVRPIDARVSPAALRRLEALLPAAGRATLDPGAGYTVHAYQGNLLAQLPHMGASRAGSMSRQPRAP